MKLEKIVLTGGPCAGKTSVMEYVREKIGALGYKVILVPETATEMKCGGVTPWECAPGVFQRSRLELQMKKEEIFERAARSMSDDKVLIVCDRGALDTRCYTTKEQFAAFAREIGSSEVMLRDSYGAVFHLESAAKGARGSYVTGEGTVRTESAEVSRR